MILIKYILILLLILPVTLIGQTKNQSDITSEWSDGTYKKYKKNDFGNFQSNGEDKIVFKKNSEGVVYLITIGSDKYEKWGKRGSSWVSGYDESNYACLFFTDDGLSIVRYVLDASSNTVSSAYKVYGEKLGKEKSLIKMINAYLKFGVEKMKEDKVLAIKAEEERNRIYGIQDKEIKDLKIIIIADNQDLDVGSEFKVGYEVTKLDGTVMKSKNLGGNAINYDYKVAVSGAAKNGTPSYTVHKECEKFENKELVISVTARSNNPITKEMKFSVDCVQKPAHVLEKEKIELEKAREAYLNSYNSRSSSSNSRTSTSKYVTIHNKTGRDIYYVEESSRNPSKISANSSARVDCSEDYWYTFDANDGINGGNSNHPKLYSANSNCGNSTTIK